MNERQRWRKVIGQTLSATGRGGRGREGERGGREEGGGRAKDTAAACVTSIPVDKEAKVNGGKGREREEEGSVDGLEEEEGRSRIERKRKE